MKKKLTAFVLSFGMVMTQIFGGATHVSAENGQNAYGHRVTYKPINLLYTGGESLKLFDANITAWAGLSDRVTQNEAESIKWLSDNNYLLNHFGRKTNTKIDTPGCFNSKGEWQTALKGPTNVRKWYANVRFDALADKEQREKGNISNLYNKGDIQYFFSYKVKTVQTRWGLTGKSNDTGITCIMNQFTNSGGGGWKKYNTILDGPNLMNFSAWESGKDLGYLSFVANSDRDDRVDSYLSGAMLVGRDIRGPKIDSVKITTDIGGKNELENGTITLDTIEKLNDRTVYFQVQWDEPVVFNNLSQDEIAKLSLNIETLGIDGTSGIIAEAPFFKFEPSKTDGKPVMVFEYKIADPYTDGSAAAQERGFYYKFSNVTVSEKENTNLWNNIYDISGNRFAADENGVQPASKVVTPVSGDAKVDLMPFGIKNIRVTKDPDDGNAFIKAGGLLGVTLELNKAFEPNAALGDMPVITLNIKDPYGKNTMIKPDENRLTKKIKWRNDWIDSWYFSNESGYLYPVMLSADRRSITYYMQLYPGYVMEGTSVKVTDVSAGKNPVKDESGYSFMNYKANEDMLCPTDIPNGAKSKTAQYCVSPDKQYKFDFEAPEIDFAVNDEGGGVVAITAAAQDSSLDGCEAAFTVKVNGRTTGGGISFQAAAGAAYDDSKWIENEKGATIASFSAPIIDGKAYGFIKLPIGCETDRITVGTVVTDEAGNSSNAEREFCAPDWAGFDTLAPAINLTVKGEDVIVDITDIDDDVTYSYGFSDDGNTEPAYTSANGKQVTVLPPDNLPVSENTVHERVLWVTAKDSRGNKSETVKLPVKYDRTFTEIVIESADTDKQYLIGDYPVVEYRVKNSTEFWYRWAEKPANVSDTAAYIADCLEKIKPDHVFDPKDFSYATAIAELSGDTSVVSVNPDDESCGESIAANDTTRPIMLIIGAGRGDGTTLVKTIEFDTFYSAPKAKVRQTRYSTNDGMGKRVDYIRDADGGGLIWADDEYENPTNTPDLNGFMQAEIQLNGDPVTKLDRVDIENSTVTLKRVLYSGKCSAENYDSSSVIGEWKFGELNFGIAADGTMSAVLNIDPKSIDTRYYVTEQGTDEYGGTYTLYKTVRYEFESKLAYKGGVEAKSEPISYFAFNNTPKGFIHSTHYDNGNFMMQYMKLSGYEKKNVEAVFDKNGSDVTAGIPVYSVNTVYPEYSNYTEFIRFCGPAEYSYRCDEAYYGTPVVNKLDPGNTAKLKVHIGTEPGNLAESLEFKADGYEFLCEPFDIGRYIYGDARDVRSVKLYYRFEHPERGTFSPVYVMIVRRDNTEPVFDISVSETERKTNEVLVKLNALTDTQKCADGTIVVDTSEAQLKSGDGYMFDAFREATDDDDLDSMPQYDVIESWVSYDEETDTNVYKYYVRVYPDEGGIYRFTSNGYIVPYAEDLAGNRNDSVLINGETVITKADGMDFPCYNIDNVSNVPPEFIREPAFTEGDGKFSLSAKSDETVKNVYIKFDDAYSQFVLGDTSEKGMFGIDNVPGIISGGFNADSKDINAEIFVKHSETVPLSSISVVIEDEYGNKTEYPYTFGTPIYGKKTEITNAKNENGYPVLKYDEALEFSTPVRLEISNADYAVTHKDISIYNDGITQIAYTDLFGESYTQDIFADIYGTAFAHTLKFISGGKEITAQTKTSADVTVTIDTGKTKNLSVDGGVTEYKFSENGILSYSLINSELGQTKQFNIPITNIDKTAPEAIVTVNTDSERDAETGAQIIYAVTYSIEGFSEDGVTMVPSENGSTLSSVTFDGMSDDLSYTFRFCDEAGNIGSYTVDASNIKFAQRRDNRIADYRLTYKISDSNGFNTIGEFGKDEPISLGLVNKEISVNIEALNKNGEVVSSSVSVNGGLPSGTAVYAKEKLVMFTAESADDRVVSLKLSGTGSGNAITVAVALPGGTIDMTAPTGTVNYAADGNSVKAYLVTNDTDLEENGVYVTGTKSDKTAFELKKDDSGYYTELDTNGVGKFILIDKAGNIGTVAIAVLSIDNEPPKIISEGWQSLVDASSEEAIKKLLETPTNSTIKLFITFNEQLSGTEVSAYKGTEPLEELKPTDEYVTALASGNFLTVEFKKNCRAKLTVYDLRGNATTVWRPEDGPITVIDRDIPKLAAGYPKRTVDKNTVKIEYVFENGEDVMLLQNHEEQYKNRHTVTFSKNGTQILNFADKAGNVFSDYPVISEIDSLAPNIKMNVDYVGTGSVLSGNDAYKAGNIYTNKNVRILLNVEDETKDGITVAAQTKSGAKIDVKSENIAFDNKLYNYYIVVSDNGSYRITATDKWGNKNSVETSVSVIDKTAPTIKFAKTAAVLKAGISQDEAGNKILSEISATDFQSGANAPIGDKFGPVTDGVTLTIDISGINLSAAGKYNAKITAADRLGNTSKRDYPIIVMKDVYMFNIGGVYVYANDVYTTAKGKISIMGANTETKYYYAKGHKTAAQMKYAQGFDPEEGFDAQERGYYTVLAQETGRKMYLLYVYVN